MIADAPELWPGNQFYYDAFLKLSSARQSVMSIGRIPWGAVADYSSRFRLGEEELDVLWRVISEMDAVYVKHMEKKKPAPPSKDENGLKSAKHLNR